MEGMERVVFCQGGVSGRFFFGPRHRRRGIYSCRIHTHICFIPFIIPPKNGRLNSMSGASHSCCGTRVVRNINLLEMHPSTEVVSIFVSGTNQIRLAGKRICTVRNGQRGDEVEPPSLRLPACIRRGASCLSHVFSIEPRALWHAFTPKNCC